MDSMDSAPLNESISGPNVMEYCSKSKTDESSKNPKVTEISDNTMNNTKPVNDTKATLKRKRASHPSTSKMVINTLKHLNISTGVPVEAIAEFMGEYYGVDTKSMMPHLHNFLRTGVEKGILERVSQDGTAGRFKIKATEKASFQTTPKKNENSEISDSKNYCETAKIPQKKNKPNHPSVSEMVLESIKSLKMRRGAPVDSIREHMARHFDVNMKYTLPHVNKFLKAGVEKGLLEKVSGVGPDERYKLRKREGTRVQAKTKVTEKSGKSDLKKVTKTPKIFEKKTKPNHPPTFDMVLESIKSLKMRRGAPVESIREHMAKHYRLDLKSITPRLNRFLKIGTEKGILEQISGVGAAGRFKIKKMEGVKMYRQTLNH